jgi:hypothetical protein
MVENLAALRDRLVEVSAARAELAIGGPSLADGSSVEDLLRLVEEGLKTKGAVKVRRSVASRARYSATTPPAEGETEGAESDAPAEKDAGIEESLKKNQAKSEEKAGAEEKAGKKADVGSPAESAKDRKKLEGAPAGGPASGLAPAAAKPPSGEAGASPRRSGMPAPGADAGAPKPGSPGNEPADGREGWSAGEAGRDKEKPGEPGGGGPPLAEEAKTLVLLEDGIEIEAPKDPLVRAMVLVYRARDLRETDGGDRGALAEAAGLLREALAAFPELPAAKAELALLRSQIENLGK